MSEFFGAALPWVALGLALAVLFANHGRQKSKEEDGAKKPGNYMEAGMCFGMCAGVVAGTTGLLPIGAGVSFGMLIGLCLGLCIPKK